MSGFVRGQAAIVGAATFGIGEAPGYDTLDLAARASIDALNQAGVALKDVDGLFLALPDDMLSGLSFAEYLGLHPKITENNRTGGSAFMSHAIVAALPAPLTLSQVADGLQLVPAATKETK